MELFVALIAIFVGGIAAYAIAQLTNGARDLRRQLRFANHAATPLAALHGHAARGPVVLRGRAMAGKKLLPGLTSAPGGCVATASRSGILMHHDTSATAFTLIDDTGMAEVEPGSAVLVAAEHSDLFGDLTREIRPGDLVTVIGMVTSEADDRAPFDSYREAPARLVVRDVPGAGLMIVRPTWQPVRTLGKGAAALVVGGLGLWGVVSLILAA